VQWRNGACRARFTIRTFRIQSIAQPSVFAGSSARGCDCSSAPKAQSNFQARRPTKARTFLSAVVCLSGQDLISILKEFAEGQIFAAFCI